MNAQQLKERMVAHAVAINEDLTQFLQAESQAVTNDLNTAKVTAYDIMYKYLMMNYNLDKREAMEALNDDINWQASDKLVYEKVAATQIITNIADYKSTIKRTALKDEDRKGYTALAEKRAAELGYNTAKAASL